MGRKKRIDSQRGFEAVVALIRRDGTAKDIARQYEMSEQTLYRLRDRFLQGGKRTLNPDKSGRDGTPEGELKAMKKELAERDRVIGEITIANRILKKTADGLY